MIINENIEKSVKLAKKGQRARISPQLFQLWSDIISIGISFFAQFWIVFLSGWFREPVSRNIFEYFNVGIAMLIYWLILFWLSGMYKNWYIRSPFEEFFSVVRVSFVGSFLIFFFIMLDEGSLMRLTFLTYFGVTALFAGGGRFVVRAIQNNARRKGLVTHSTLLVGTKKEVLELFDKIGKNKQWGFKPVGVVLAGEEEIEKWGNPVDETDIPLLGTADNMEEILKKVRPKEALISVDSPDKYHGMLLKTVSYCYDANTHVKIDPSLYQIFTGQMRTLPVWGAPLIVISPQLLKPWQVFLKRLTDIIFSLLVIVLGLPFWVVVALIVKLGSKGPVFYAQERVGKGSKNFMMYKFRSMTQDAEKSGPQWAKVNDPRVTPFGRFLRKSHLDEVPQFWNVLKGDMSLVGPRPERPVFVEKFSKIFPQYKRRLILRPGLTGWWQIHYTTYSESDEEIQNRLKDDFYYIENISFKLDLEIMLRTVFAVLKGHGQA